MDILDVGINKGRLEGIQALIETCQEFHASREETLERIMQKFNLSEDKVKEYMDKYWK